MDPLAEQTMTPYQYVNNNPVRYIDPDGRVLIIPWLLKAGTGAAADMLAQATMDYMFNSNTKSWSQAFDNVNWYQVGRSSAEGLIPWKTPGGRIGRAASTAVVDVLVNAANNPNGYTSEQAGFDFATGFIGDLSGGGFNELISKYGNKSVANGLKKLNFSSSKIFSLTGINTANVSNRLSWINKKGGVYSKGQGKMGRHIFGHPDFIPGKSYFNNIGDAEKVLNAYHSGDVTVLRVINENTVEFQYTGVDGFFHNLPMIRDGKAPEATNIFRIEGTNQAKIVPLNPQTKK